MNGDVELTRKLIMLAHNAGPVERQTGDWQFDVVLPSSDGWQVGFFYDCGDLDYIDHFVSPAGERIEVWEDDPRFEFPERELDFSFQPLRCWRGCDDTERLLKLLN
jgi:hypothetical protein